MTAAREQLADFAGKMQAVTEAEAQQAAAASDALPGLEAASGGSRRTRRGPSAPTWTVCR